MTRRTSTGLFAACAALSASSLAMLTTTDARACGGCFTQTSTPGGSESTIVTAHRMALSVSTERTVLWDQIQYQGAPEEFAWVLPVKPGTTINLASDAFFEALDAATTAHASPPPGVVCTQTSPGMNGNVDGYGYYGGCSITGCGSGRSLGEVGAGGGGGSTTITIGVPVSIPTVEVVHQESIGPYEAVVLSSNKPGALYDWLLDHGFGIDPTMEPIVDAYEAESFDFVALRLIPGADVRQMRPVRVISPGAAPVLPLRMVAAGTGANVAMTLFLLGEGRWSPSNFPAAEIYQGQVEWDFDTSSSNYAPLRAGALAAGDGSSWLTTYSKPGALLGQVFNPVSMTNVTYQTSLGQSANSIAELYVLQALANGEITDTSCLQGIYNAANGYGKVVDPCGDQTQEGGAGGAGGSTASTATGGSGGAGGSTAGPAAARPRGRSRRQHGHGRRRREHGHRNRGSRRRHGDGRQRRRRPRGHMRTLRMLSRRWPRVRLQRVRDGDLPGQPRMLPRRVGRRVRGADHPRLSPRVRTGRPALPGRRAAGRRPRLDPRLR